ncbi:cache domain-containing protein [Candidatus Gottesmanbacteria bacterium]|nr:cache domain-containing protein [Candidatus Gottesmanbacteria bacterium]
MWVQFILQNTHFAINLAMALVAFAVAWLYLDAWSEKKKTKELVKIVGFILLSLSFLFHAAKIETGILSSSLFGGGGLDSLVNAVRSLSYLTLIVSLVMDPPEPHPKNNKSTRGSSDSRVSSVVLPALGFSVLSLSSVSLPILAVIVGFLYLRRATVGLEDHLKPVALGFFLLAFSELVGLQALFSGTTDIRLVPYVSSFGVLWMLEHGVLTLGVLIFGRWVFGYLLRQFETQLFMFFTSGAIIIFLVTTVVFTGLLVKNIEDETLSQLGIDVSVLSYALDSKKQESLSASESFSKSSDLAALIEAGDKRKLVDVVSSALLDTKQNSLIVTNDAGLVLARGEESERIGDSLSSDPLVKRALLGEKGTSVITREGVVAPDVLVRAAVPVNKGTTVVGTVVASSRIDAAFVDGLKSATALDSAVYGDNTISATTFVGSDAVTRLTGIKEERKEVKETVLSKGKQFTSAVSLVSVPYFASYMPLLDIDNTPVGMLFIGKPQSRVLAAAGRSIELTFLSTIVLILFTVIPSYLIAKYIAYQVE